MATVLKPFSLNQPGAGVVPKGGPVTSKGGFGGGGPGTNFRSLFSGAPNAKIARPIVGMPDRGDFGGPAAPPTIALPTRKDYGTPDLRGLNETARAARNAEFGFNNPTETGAFKRLMAYSQEVTGAQEGERGRRAADIAQRRGYSGGFEDEARQAQSDKMSALAQAGFIGAEQVRAQEGEQYGRAIGAFSQLMDSYQQAKAAGDTSFARDLTQSRIAQAEAQLKTLDINTTRGLGYANAVNEAKRLQAQLDSAYNKDLIDNNRYIQQQQQLAAQLMAQQAALAEKRREFDIESAQDAQEQKFKQEAFDRQFKEQQRQFDLGLLADPDTAYRALEDPSLRDKKRPGETFRSFLA